MKRIIKFRGHKCQGGGEWIYGNCLIQNSAGTRYIANDIAPSKTSEGNYSEVVHVCQFTGFKDKFGKDIYEGDIIQSDRHNKPTHAIIYDSEMGSFMAKQLNYEYGAYCHINQRWIDEFGKYIVGNIYDNTKVQIPLERLRKEKTDE